MREVLDLVRGKPAKYAIDILANLNKKGAYLLAKILNSAIANAKNKGHGIDALFISKLTADGGPVLKRYRSATFGRANTIKKRTSHVTLELDTTEKIIDVKSSSHRKAAKLPVLPAARRKSPPSLKLRRNLAEGSPKADAKKENDQSSPKINTLKKENKG